MTCHLAMYIFSNQPLADDGVGQIDNMTQTCSYRADIVMRGPTAFFLFSEEKREQTRAECVAAAEAGAKISVAVVAKAIGEKWRALTDAEKAEYQEKASQRAKELSESAAAEAENEAGVPLGNFSRLSMKV